jgi:hypothetical protein
MQWTKSSSSWIRSPDGSKRRVHYLVFTIDDGIKSFDSFDLSIVEINNHRVARSALPMGIAPEAMVGYL